MHIRPGICQCSIPVPDAEECLVFATQLGLEDIEPDVGMIYPAIAVNALWQYGMS